MIGKVPEQGKSFRGVVNYLLVGKKNDPEPDRVAWVETRNLLVSDPKKAATLMRLTARKSKRVKTPVYHYVISWREDESPTDDVMRMVADTTCKDLGLDEYQMLYVAHRDTDHRHVHIVVNRVHPESGRAWTNSHDYRRIECSLRRQAEGMGMHYVPGRHNDPEAFYGVARAPVDREWQRNRRLKLRDLPRFDEATRAQYRDRLAEIVTDSTSWSDLDFRLSGLGFSVLRKGQGLVLANESGTMKLSDLGRDIRLKGLEERFKGSLAEHEKERIQAKAMEKARVPSQRKKPVRKHEPDRQPHEEEAARPTAQQKEPSPAFEELREAGDKADMTYSLYNMGLASKDQMERAMKERQRAQEKVDASKTFLDRVNRDLFRQREPEAPAPPPDREGPARQRRRDRGRGR